MIECVNDELKNMCNRSVNNFLINILGALTQSDLGYPQIRKKASGIQRPFSLAIA